MSTSAAPENNTTGAEHTHSYNITHNLLHDPNASYQCCQLFKKTFFYKSIVLLTSLPGWFVEGKVGDMKHGGFSDDIFKSCFFSNMPTKKIQYKHTKILSCVIAFLGSLINNLNVIFFKR